MTGSPSQKKDSWDKTSIGIELAYKVLILIAGSIAAGVFYVYRETETQRRSMADLMVQRDSSDSQLRAQMFRTLFDAYFADMVHAESAATDFAAAGGTAARLLMLKRESIFSDLLSRNFEDIDTRPLREDLDGQLSQYLGTDFRATDEVRQKAFLLREYLRRSSIGGASRQVSSLIGRLGAKVRTSMVTQCRGSDPEPSFPFQEWNVQATSLNDGIVDMVVVPDMESKNSDTPTYIEVSFYDVPKLENITLPSGARIAFVLARYVSHDACMNFGKLLDDSLQQECAALPAGGVPCDRAYLKAVVLPDDYVGTHDRANSSNAITGGGPNPAKDKP